MITALAIIVIAAAVGGLVAGPVRPTSPAARRRRRRRYLDRHPRSATLDDIERLLAGAVPPMAVRPLTNQIRRQRLEPPVLWEWAEHNGVDALGLALCADFDDDDFHTLEIDGRHFDETSLRMLAELNGGSLGALLLSDLDDHNDHNDHNDGALA